MLPAGMKSACGSVVLIERSHHIVVDHLADLVIRIRTKALVTRKGNQRDLWAASERNSSGAMCTIPYESTDQRGMKWILKFVFA
eukprot:scaffold3910_cov182-Amphora_coffeaeformis.AAC.5